MRQVVLTLFACLLALLPVAAFAHGDEEHNSSQDAFELKLNGFYHLQPGQIAGTVIVINDDALIEGTVEDLLIIINGDALITGTVEGDVVVISGGLELREFATIEDDLFLIRSELDQDPTVTIGGDIEVRTGWFLSGGVGFLIGFVLWVWFAVAALVVAFLFAAVAGRQLNAAAIAMTQQPGYTLLSIVLLWVAGGAVVAALAATVVGIGAALMTVLLFVPVVAMLGFVVSGMWLGRFIVGLFNREPAPDHPISPR